MSDNESSREKEICENLIYKAEQIKQRPYRRFNYHFGMVAALGGAIIIPILLGIWLGSYLDNTYPQKFSWRLSLLFIGFVWGGFNAYWWLKIENDKIAKLEKNNIKERRINQ